ncbi:T9SS type B sorting domain-containing protein [Subsaxibacter sp. CAU 1640]|uniref:T9SS type B sorting domain-containing protein n=1 Tax=Subsaxibacter sp. CAU 1640 TaxID=2933271 RepID=UPI00200431DC|nr:T9SS type B sorting domain-containing protein [Subsaxibacter sp. CAU 1640]MCK7590692.1 T9SS type B sorting domain-containing protein [Subsaxibacter sp. CAU 1640]
MKKPTFSRLALLASFLFLGMQAFAQNYVPFTPRFNQDLKGDIILIGNNILGPSNNAFNDNSVYNHNVDMRYIDIDGDNSTFSSSSADLDIPNPNCYRIKYAGLYWGAVTSGPESITNVKFKGPTGGYHDVTGTIVYDANGTATGQSFPYSCYADVTDIVTGLANNLGTYTIANVSSAQGATGTFDPYNGTGYSAGWSLFVVYEDPTLPGKSITSFDGFSAISSSVNVDIPISGFRTIPAPAPVRANFAFATLEGDKPIQNDRLVLNGIPMSAADRPANNFFNSSVTQLSALPVTTRNPNSTNTLGFDTGVMHVPNPGNTVIANDATSALVRLESNQDVYFQYFFAFAVEIIEPNIVLTKIVEDDLGNNIGGQTVGLSQPLNYVIGFQNTGNDNATNFQIRDILPINIIFNYPTDLVLPPGVTVASYNPATREIIFDIEDYLVEENDPVYEIRIEVMTVETCNQLADACSNIINNQAFATYNGFFNPNFQITDDPSFSSNTGCLITPQATNFLADLDDCTFSENIVLCGSSVTLTAANGYDSYSWSTNPSGNPVIGTTQSITVTSTGTYYVHNTATAPCQSIVQEFEVGIYGGSIPNPVIPFADEVVTCPNDGKLLPLIFLCGANDFRDITTNISGATSIIWEQLDESSCAAVSNADCANENPSCTWNQVATGPNFTANTSGQFRLTINYEGGCFNQFYFNVYQNLLSPTVTATDIICTTPGSITVNGVPSGYEYSIDGVNYQSSNVFSVNTPGIYTAYIRQVGVPTNPCVFTVPDVQIRERNFTVSTIVNQPLCHGDKGTIRLAANDVRPQYFFSIYNGATLVNSVGPINANNYTFANLNPGTYTTNVSTEDGCEYTGTVTIAEPPLLTVTAAVTSPLTCTDGEITIYPVGGTPPYFYFVNSTTDFQTVPEIIVTAPGTYNIMVVDANNCSATTTIEVDSTPAPEFTLATTDIECSGSNNGNITINVSNANGSSIRYSIDGGTTFFNSPVFNGLSQGDYDVVLEYTLGGSICLTDPQTVTINSTSGVEGTATLTAPFTCSSNGTITVSNVTGGTPPYTYSIDGVNFQNGTSFSGLTSGTYTITIKDSSGCTSIADVITIDALNPPTDMTFSSSPVTCPTNTADITVASVTGGVGTLVYQIIAPSSAATSYQTSNVFAGLSPGTYTFQVRDENDCVYSESFTISPLPPLTVSTVLTKDLDCTSSPDAVITGTISGGTPPFTYAVSFNGGAYSSLGATGSPFTYATGTSGTYQFQITDASGCVVESGTQTVLPLSPPALSLVAQTQDILCNGNSNGAIQVTIDTSVGTPPFVINVYNDTTGTDFGTQTSGLPAGSYTVTVTDAKSCTATETVVIDQPDPIIVNYHTVDITCTAAGVSQGSIIIDAVTGGTAPYNYFVTGTNGYSNSELNATGSTSVTFDVVDFGLYQINVVDANGCSVLFQDVLVASPPTDLDINIETTVDCLSGGEATVSIGSSLPSAGPFFFSIYQGPSSVYPNPAGTWIPEDSPGSQSATFTGLTPGVVYTFIVYDASTNCSYYEPAAAPIPTNSTLTATAVTANNITCTGSADGNVSFTVNSVYGSATNISYEIFDSLSLNTTGVSGTGVVPANGSLNVTNLGPLPFGNYYVLITETSGPNNGCGVVTVPFNITESAIPLSLTTSVDQNANCNANSGVISAVGQNGTSPYQYQITTTATAPAANDTLWASASVFNTDAGNYYVHVIDAYGCIVTSPVVVLPADPSPVISGTVTNQCTATEGSFEIEVTLDSAGMSPYSFSIDGGAFQTRVPPFTVSNLTSGAHTVEIRDVNGCGNTITINIAPPLDVTPSVTTVPSCNNDDGVITVTGSGGTGSYSYAISPNPASISLAGNVFSGVPSGLYTISITDNNTLCTEEVEVSLPTAVPPTFTTTSTPVICFGDNSGSFTINVNGYSGPYTYEVFNTSGVSVLGPVATNTSTNPETVSGMTAGSYTVVITETASPFCSATSTVIISSPAEQLVLAASETSNVTCDNNLGTISAIAIGGWGSYEYELTGAATVAYSSNGTFTDLSAGNYTVNVRDAQNCIASVNVTLSVPNPITAMFTPNTTLLSCFGDQDASIIVTNVSGGQGGNYTYTLNSILPTPSSSGPQTSNVFNGLGEGTYNVTITDGYNCEMTSTDIVITQPTPIQANLVVTTTPTCLTQATLTLSASGGTGNYTYSNNSNFSPVLGTFTSSVTFSVPAGTYEYYVRDANGCVANVSNEITIDELPELTIDLTASNPTINCAGDNTGSVVADAQGGLGNYVYTLQDSAGNAIPATQNSPGVFTQLVAGTYIVNVLSGDCEETSAPVTITEPSAPLEATFNISNVSCSGSNNGSLEILATGGTGIIKYAISPQLNQFFETNVFENLAPGNYDVIVQDILGCYLTFNFTITEPAPVIISIVADSMFPEVCEGDALGEFSIDISGGTAPYSVNLDNYDGTYTTGTLTQTQFDFTGLGGGDHTVFVRDAEGCESEWNITFPESVTINPLIEVENLCENNVGTNMVVVTVDESNTDLSQLDYSLDGGPYQSSNIFTNIPAGVDHFINVRHTNGCIQTTEFFDIDEIQPVTITLSEGDLNEIIANANGGSGDYTYTFNGENYGTTNEFIITESGTYTIAVTDSWGCMASASLYLEFVDICIPNYFTPNNDGVTDGWAPGCTDNYPNLEFDIFDRYGRKVATYRVGEYWDGKYNNRELPTGDYWYVVRLNSSTNDRDFVGHFTLYR